MPIDALLLVLLAAFIHASWNLLLKRVREPAVPLTFAITGVMSVAYTPVALLLYGDSLAAIPGFGWQLIAASGLLHVAYFLALQTGYARADLSVVYPVARGVGPLISAVLAIILFAEPVTPGAVAGLLLIVGGTFVIAGGVEIVRRGWSPGTRAGLGWGAATGLFIAGYTIIDGAAIKLASIAPVLFDWLSNLARLVLVAPLALRGEARAQLVPLLRRNWRAVTAIALISPISYILVLSAMRVAPVSHVAPAREVSMLIAAFFGARLLGEGHLARRLLGAAMIAGGVAGLTLG